MSEETLFVMNVGDEAIIDEKEPSNSDVVAMFDNLSTRLDNMEKQLRGLNENLKEYIKQTRLKVEKK